MRTTAVAILVLGVAATACRSNDDGNCVVTTVALQGAPATINQGNSASLSAKVTATSCSGLQLVWTSSNDSVLKVDQTGTITGVSAGGPVTVTVLAGTITATVQVTVVVLPVASVAVVPDSLIIPIGGTYQLATVLTGNDSSTIANRSVTWSIGSVGAAVVGPSGFLTGVGRGSAVVTATSETKSGTAKVFVAAPRLVYFLNDLPDIEIATTPDSNYSFSNDNGVETVASTTTGVYALTFTNFARAGAETEVPFLTQNGGTDAGFCSVAAWANEAATVDCYDQTGTPTPTSFDFAVIGSATFPSRFAYAWANDGSPTLPYAAPGGFRYSSSNQPITITKTALGAYTVLFAGQGRALAGDREALMVSSYGTLGVSCQLADWTATVAADLTATVRCFTAAGVAADSPFNIGLVSKPRPGASLAFADANEPTIVTYTPTNSAVLPTGLTTLTRFGPGLYSVRFDGFVRVDSLKESFMVTPVAATPVRCHVEEGGWTFDLDGATVGIVCANPAGAAVDSRFVIVGLQ